MDWNNVAEAPWGNDSISLTSKSLKKLPGWVFFFCIFKMFTYFQWGL